jgi:hypothetical protein
MRIVIVREKNIPVVGDKHKNLDWRRDYRNAHLPPL